MISQGIMLSYALWLHTKLYEKPRLGCDTLGYTTGPRLNAAGRLGQAELAIELLTTEDQGRANTIAQSMEELNLQRQSLERSIDRGRIVVGFLAASQDHVAVLVTQGRDNGGMPGLGHRKKMVRAGGGADGIHRDPYIAVGAILEPDRAGQAGGQFPVHLRFGGTGADRTPGHQVGGVLRRDGVEEIGRAHV